MCFDKFLSLLKYKYFKYKSIDPIIRLFNSIASKHKVQLQKYNSKLIDFSEIHSHYFNGIYSHPDIAKIIIRKFCSNLDDIRNWIKLLESHKYEIKGATLNIMSTSFYKLYAVP